MSKRGSTRPQLEEGDGSVFGGGEMVVVGVDEGEGGDDWKVGMIGFGCG